MKTIDDAVFDTADTTTLDAAAPTAMADMPSIDDGNAIGNDDDDPDVDDVAVPHCTIQLPSQEGNLIYPLATSEDANPEAVAMDAIDPVIQDLKTVKDELLSFAPCLTSVKSVSANAEAAAIPLRFTFVALSFDVIVVSFPASDSSAAC